MKKTGQKKKKKKKKKKEKEEEEEEEEEKKKKRKKKKKKKNKKKKTLSTTKLDLNLRKKPVKCYICSTALYDTKTWALCRADQKYPGKFLNVVLVKDGVESLGRSSEKWSIYKESMRKGISYVQ